MALGTQNQAQQQLYQRQQQQMLATRSIYQQRQRLIAPAPNTRPYAAPYTKPTSAYAAGTTLDSNNPAVVRRNARERNRVKQVNNGFVHLRQHLPQAIVADLSNGRRGIGPGAHKKLSKVDTLRMAVEYIRRLQNVIEEVDGSDVSSVSSYGSCGASSSGSPPPQPMASKRQTQLYDTLSYAGSFQQPHQQQSMLISPAGSTSSSTYSSDSYTYYQHTPTSTSANASLPVKLKVEQSYDEYSNTIIEDEDILEYISLWQEEL